jgi:hypothetical protein
MKNAVSLFLLLLLNIFVNAQQLGFEVHTGYGTYQMHNLRKFNNYVKEELPFTSAINPNFPGYLYYMGSVFLKGETAQFGVNLGYYSTGSRVSSSDYSGEYRFDNLINAWQPGIIMRFEVENFDDAILFASFGTGMIFSQLNLSEFLKVYDEILIDYQHGFSSLNYFIEPGLHVAIPFWKFTIALQTKYLFQLGNKNFKGSDNNQITNPETGKQLKPNWDGLRFDISLGYAIQFKKASYPSNQHFRQPSRIAWNPG